MYLGPWYPSSPVFIWGTVLKLLFSNGILMCADTGEHSVLLLLYLTLMTTLFSLVDVGNGWAWMTLDWFASNLAIDDSISSPGPFTCGVPQGSTIGHILFYLYMLPLGFSFKPCKTHIAFSSLTLTKQNCRIHFRMVLITYKALNKLAPLIFLNICVLCLQWDHGDPLGSVTKSLWLSWNLG